MKASSKGVRLICARNPVTATADLPATAPSQIPDPIASTGTVDDVDEPEDEHVGENEASVRKTRDETEARKEFETDDDDIRYPGS
jgi:hypothetical protein